MIESIGQFGPGLKPPTYHELRVSCLRKELETTNELMRSHKAEWAKVGCIVMADGWTDRRNRTLINFLVNSPKGTMFIESIDASSYVKDGKKMFELLDNFVERIGEANVVQVVTDSASANVMAGKNVNYYAIREIVRFSEFYAKCILIFFVNREIVRSKATTINMVSMCCSLLRFNVGGYIQDLQYSQSIEKRHGD